MIGEIISIGDELVCGQSLDTNSQWLAQQLSECGVDVCVHTTIGDRLDDYLVAFATARDRCSIVVSTGGLGPTEDDLTRAALARLAGVELDFDEDSWRHIQELFARYRRSAPEKNIVQAYHPRGSHVIPNADGTAPGLTSRWPATADIPAVFSPFRVCPRKCEKCGINTFATPFGK